MPEMYMIRWGMSIFVGFHKNTDDRAARHAGHD